jgi:hypothetical protein
MLSGILLNAIILSVILLNAIILSVILLNVTMLSVAFVIFMLSLACFFINAECHYAECRFAECRGTLIFYFQGS